MRGKASKERISLNEPEIPWGQIHSTLVQLVRDAQPGGTEGMWENVQGMYFVLRLRYSIDAHHLFPQPVLREQHTVQLC